MSLPLREHPNLVVVDVGGTTLRVGRVVGDRSAVSDVRRVPTAGIGRGSCASATQLQRRVIDQLVETVDGYVRTVDGRPVDALGVSFAGPMTRRGVVTAAPTVWGPGAPPVALGSVLRRRLDVPVVVANDVTAAAARYVGPGNESFCLFTVSSGIGNKVVVGGKVLVDDDGHGGELGHWRVDLRPDAMPCDCGGRGHLGALASGRGVLAAASAAASERPHEFSRSALAGLTAGDPTRISNEMLVATIHRDDPFAVEILRSTLRPLASAISCLFSALGLRRYIVVGGLAIAIGAPFVTLLCDEMIRAGCFGLDSDQIRAMVSLGEPDDDHSLVGIARLAHRALRDNETVGDLHAHVDRW